MVLCLAWPCYTLVSVPSLFFVARSGRWGTLPRRLQSEEIFKQMWHKERTGPLLRGWVLRPPAEYHPWWRPWCQQALVPYDRAWCHVRSSEWFFADRFSHWPVAPSAEPQLSFGRSRPPEGVYIIRLNIIDKGHTSVRAKLRIAKSLLWMTCAPLFLNLASQIVWSALQDAFRPFESVAVSHTTSPFPWSP